MKKLLVFLTSLALVFSLAACTDDGETPTGGSGNEPVGNVEGVPEEVTGKTLKIALIKQWGTGTHMVTHINGVRAEADRYGIDLTVVDANHDLQKMSEGISTAVTNKVDAILISHGKADALQSAVEEALNAGIPVIAFDVDFDIPETIAKGKLVSLDQNDLMMGLMSLSKMVEELDGSGNIIYNRLAGITPTDKRHRIWEGAIVPTYPGMNVVSTIDQGTDGAMGKAQTAMEAALIANTDVDGVFAVWDEYAKGFYNAMVQAERVIPMYSIDISDQDLAMMQARPDIWRASAAVDPTVVGQVQIRLALKAIAGQDIPRYYSLQPVLILVDDLPADKQVTMTDLADYYDGWGSTTEFLDDWMLLLEEAVTSE
jgi:simple sugar transport system substrate-binding protein